MQALLVSSAHALEALRDGPRSLPLFAVGSATAQAARRLGYRHVHTAEGDLNALEALVIERLDPQAGSVVYLSGHVVSRGLRLGHHGFEVRREVVYEARQVAHLPRHALAALTRGQVDAAVFFSPRSARCFARLLRAAGLDMRGIVAVCLSSAVARPLGSLAPGALHSAPEPTQESLLELLCVCVPPDKRKTNAPL